MPKYPVVDNWKDALDEALKVRGEPRSIEEAFGTCALAAVYILMSKQAKYGKDNLLEFKEAGLAIRMNDKMQRIKNAAFKGADLGKEGYEESFGDLAGYGFLGILLERGWIENLPLFTSEDVKYNPKDIVLK